MIGEYMESISKDEFLNIVEKYTKQSLTKKQRLGDIVSLGVRGYYIKY